MSKLIYIPRNVWGAAASTEDFIRNRISDSRLGKTTIQVHHTAAIDTDDLTPNRWDYGEAAAYLRKLQYSRPDLGPLPYSVNLAISEDLQTVWVFEGRGVLKRGAHTAGHNIDGVGFGVLGNFDRHDSEAAAVIVEAINTICTDLREGGRWALLLTAGLLLPKLGDDLNPNGWRAWGHRDTSTKTCPGHSLYPRLPAITLEREDEEMSLKETLIDLAFEAGWAEPDTEAARRYWYGVNPSSTEWNDMRNAIKRGARQLRTANEGLKRGDSVTLG